MPTVYNDNFAKNLNKVTYQILHLRQIRMNHLGGPNNISHSVDVTPLEVGN